MVPLKGEKISLYTQGWRFGGKCATGQNQTAGARIEEHGLHVLIGCYENAFHTIRACYGEWQPRLGSPFHEVSDAFTPEWQLTLMEQDDPDDAWTPWEFFFPPSAGMPGDEPADENLLNALFISSGERNEPHKWAYAISIGFSKSYCPTYRTLSGTTTLTSCLFCLMG
jgi:uncharacterized protein with NAD-binding domain and iron-sulfur cluster